MSTYIPGVGKSSIITRYIKGDYRKECEATIGASFMYAKVTIRDYTITLKVILKFFKTHYSLYYYFF
jgi:GTPase SAR1 family protein